MESEHTLTHTTSRPHEQAARSMESQHLPISIMNRRQETRELLSLKTTVSSKMQITIPMTLAKLFEVLPGDVLRFTKYETNASTHRLVVEQVRGGRIHQTFRIRARPSPSSK